MPRIAVAQDDNGNLYVFASDHTVQVEFFGIGQAAQPIEAMDDVEAVHDEVGRNNYPYVVYNEAVEDTSDFVKPA